MSPPIEQAQSAQEAPPLILKIDESEISGQMEMERFIKFIAKNVDSDRCPFDTISSPVGRRGLERFNHFPFGSLDFFEFMRTKKYRDRIDALSEEYKMSGAPNKFSSAPLELIIEAGEEYDELIPFIIRTRSEFLLNFFSEKGDYRLLSFAGKQPETTVAAFAPAVVVLIWGAIAVNVAGVTSGYLAVKAYSSVLGRIDN